MKKMAVLATMIALLFSTSIYTVFSTPHKMLMDYKVGRIDIEVYFSDGTPARYVDVKVYYPDGSIYSEGKTDEEGKFSFEPDRPGNWKVIAEGAMGHRTETVIDFKEQEAGEEMPLYARVIAGLGYLIGMAGIATGYMGWRAKKRREE